MAIGGFAARQGSSVVVTQQTLDGLRVSTGPGSGRFTTQGNIPPVPNPVAQFLARNLEPIVRPAVSDKAYRLLDRLLAARAKAGELTEASILWGGPSNFEIADKAAPTQPSIGVQVGGGGTTTDPDHSQQTIVYDEVSRETTVVRITQEDNPENFLDVERIDSITFRGPDNILRQFNLNWQ